MKGEIIPQKTVLEEKKLLVSNIIEKIKNYRTILLVSTKNLPASQFQSIKKKLRGKAEIVMAKKSIIIRAISSVEKGTLQNLKKEITADVALIFSKAEAFELAGLLIDYQSPIKARPGDIAPEDITIEPGPTDLIPGPAISELSSVGLKVAVEGGKLAIKQPTTIVKKGEQIKENVAGVLSKLKITPMKVGFIPLAAYDAKEEIIYKEIKIDKKATLEELKNAISKASGFAVSLGYVTNETISYLISKASLEERVVENLIQKDKNKKIENPEEGNE